ncbi:MAG: polysaccharide biosynthesis protein [Eubacterium sp.]|nr:polysaccharide biosynthesis protein [Eubacterium sp.]
MSRNSESSFLVQGSILAIASIVSRIIGMLYRIPLYYIIGDHGNDYYGTAFEIYTLLLFISSYSLPMAVSKMVSARMAKRQVRNAYRVFRGALLFSLCTGLIGALVIFFFAGPLCALFRTPMAIFALRVLAPTLLIVALMGVFRGFFQGLGTTVPSAFSQVIEQIINAIVSIAAAFVLFRYAAKTFTEQTDLYSAAYGAAGGTLGTGAGALIGFVFLLLIFFAFRPHFLKLAERTERRQKNTYTESYRTIMRVLIMTVVPILLSTTVYNLVSVADQILFKNIANLQNYAANDISIWWGVYTGKYRVLTNVPISIASAIGASAVPVITSAFTMKDHEKVRGRIDLAIRFEMIVAFPCTAGLIVLASPIQQLLFSDATRLAAGLLIAGSISVIFYSISTLSNATLQAIDRMHVPVKNAVISLVIQAVALILCMFVFHMGIYSVIAANIVFSFVMCILNGRAVKRYSGFSPNITKTFVKPGIAAVIMGVAVLLIYRLIMLVTGINAIGTVIGILAGIIIYFIVLLLIKGITESELLDFPKGSMIIRIAKKAHLL